MPSREIVPWPDNWRYDRNTVKCLVDGCEFEVQPGGLTRQYEDLKDHCRAVTGSEHAILLTMLAQRKCVVCEYRVSHGQSTSSKLRKLFAHEKTAHGTYTMSHMSTYVVLARRGSVEGRHGDHAQTIAFDRMVEKLGRCGQPIAQLLCQKGGLPYSLENLKIILSGSNARSAGVPNPLWWPVPPNEFLWQLRPDDDNPSDYQWGRVWTRLRQLYRIGLL